MNSEFWKKGTFRWESRVSCLVWLKIRPTTVPRSEIELAYQLHAHSTCHRGLEGMRGFAGCVRDFRGFSRVYGECFRVRFVAPMWRNRAQSRDKLFLESEQSSAGVVQVCHAHDRHYRRAPVFHDVLNLDVVAHVGATRWTTLTVRSRACRPARGRCRCRSPGCSAAIQPFLQHKTTQVKERRPSHEAAVTFSSRPYGRNLFEAPGPSR